MTLAFDGVVESGETVSTPAMRKIIVYIATSADGYIARPDGNIDWLHRANARGGDYDLGAFMRSIDAVIWGRKTYDQVQGFTSGRATGDFGKDVRHYIFSTQRPAESSNGVAWVSEPVAAFVRRLRAEKGKNIWMMGGGGIIASFLDAGEIDEFMIHVIPAMIGDGIPLVAPRHRHIPLRLKSSKKFSDGVVRLHYEVVGPGRRHGAKAAGKRSGRARTKASSRAHRRGTRR